VKPERLSASADGPLRLFTTVGSPPPFALSLSKSQAELVEAFVPQTKGFDRLSPNGDNAGLPTTSSGLSEQPPQPERFCADTEVRLRAASRRQCHQRYGETAFIARATYSSFSPTGAT
jgi:hypothetical protein